MTNRIPVALVAAALVCAGASAQGAEKREMNVRQGPESVFDRPVGEIMAELDGAEATDENGRVGNELVFWGYELADGREAFFFACAMLPDIDCDARRRSICPGNATLVRSDQVAGKVRHVHCRSVGIVGVGDLRPGCADEEQSVNLAVGLLQCN